MIIKIRRVDCNSWFIHDGIKSFKYGSAFLLKEMDSMLDKTKIKVDNKNLPIDAVFLNSTDYNSSQLENIASTEIDEYDNKNAVIDMFFCTYLSYDKKISYSFKPDYFVVNEDLIDYHREEKKKLYLNWIHTTNGSNLWFVFSNEAYICSDDGKTIDVVR